MQGPDLQACLGFPLPGGDVPSFTVFHDGGDAWGPNWIRFLLDDSTWVQCPGFDIDNANTTTSDCAPFKP